MNKLEERADSRYGGVKSIDDKQEMAEDQTIFHRAIDKQSSLFSMVWFPLRNETLIDLRVVEGEKGSNYYFSSVYYGSGIRIS